MAQESILRISMPFWSGSGPSVLSRSPLPLKNFYSLATSTMMNIRESGSEAAENFKTSRIRHIYVKPSPSVTN